MQSLNTCLPRIDGINDIEIAGGVLARAVARGQRRARRQANQRLARLLAGGKPPNPGFASSVQTKRRAGLSYPPGTAQQVATFADCGAAGRRHQSIALLQDSTEPALATTEGGNLVHRKLVAAAVVLSLQRSASQQTVGVPPPREHLCA